VDLAKLATSDPAVPCWAGSCRSARARLAARPAFACQPPTLSAFVLSHSAQLLHSSTPDRAGSFHSLTFSSSTSTFSLPGSPDDLPSNCARSVPVAGRAGPECKLQRRTSPPLQGKRPPARSNNTIPTAGNDTGNCGETALQLFLSSPGLALSERKIGQSDETRTHASTFPGNTDGHKSDRFLPSTTCQTY
jgi:hypothetical protein